MHEGRSEEERLTLRGGSLLLTLLLANLGLDILQAGLNSSALLHKLLDLKSDSGHMGPSIRLKTVEEGKGWHTLTLAILDNLSRPKHDVVLGALSKVI